jgi:hypothetical protein
MQVTNRQGCAKAAVIVMGQKRVLQLCRILIFVGQKDHSLRFKPKLLVNFSAAVQLNHLPAAARAAKCTSVQL